MPPTFTLLCPHTGGDSNCVITNAFMFQPLSISFALIPLAPAAPSYQPWTPWGLGSGVPLCLAKTEDLPQRSSWGGVSVSAYRGGLPRKGLQGCAGGHTQNPCSLVPKSLPTVSSTPTILCFPFTISQSWKMRFQTESGSK